MQMSGLQFPEFDYYNMPTRRRAKYLALCTHKNKEEAKAAGKK